jgi:hypothetical protein
MKPDETKTLSVPVAGRLYFGLGRNASYEAAKRGEIPTIKIVSRLRVPIVALELMLAQACRPSPTGPIQQITEAGTQRAKQVQNIHAARKAAEPKSSAAPVAYAAPTNRTPQPPSATPSSIPSVAADREAAVEATLIELGRPGFALPWKRFDDAVHARCGVGAAARGYSHRTIQRVVAEILTRQRGTSKGTSTT